MLFTRSFLPVTETRKQSYVSEPGFTHTVQITPLQKTGTSPGESSGTQLHPQVYTFER